MSRRVSNEARLISALVQTSQLDTVIQRGVEPEMFRAYQAEFRWLISYQHTYGETPSPEVLKSKFPSFPLTDEDEVHYYADEVRTAHTKRELSETLETAARHIAEDDLESAVYTVAAFSPPMYKGIPLENTLADESFLTTWHEKIETIRTPWPTLENLTGGIQPGELWYVAARLGQGKSWTLANFACTAAIDGKRVLYVSLEMSERQVQQRLHVMLGNHYKVPVTHKALKDREISVTEYRDLMHVIREKVQGTVSVLDQTRGPVSPAKVQSMIQDYDLVVVDYAGLMHSAMGSRAVEDWRVMAAISNQLQEVAASTEVPIIAAAQINREGDTAGPRPPRVKNLAQSDALGQDGSVVITQKQWSKRVNVYSVEKNRSGETGLFYTEFKPNTGEFKEINRERAQQLYDDTKDDD